ncbi:MAG: hypothetical protein FWD29_06910 [Micrococcales bacterium]|nr:hypothetical protein [Micrococcales bacterium]
MFNPVSGMGSLVRAVAWLGSTELRTATRISTFLDAADRLRQVGSVSEADALEIQAKADALTLVNKHQGGRRRDAVVAGVALGSVMVALVAAVVGPFLAWGFWTWIISLAGLITAGYSWTWLMTLARWSDSYRLLEAAAAEAEGESGSESG